MKNNCILKCAACGKKLENNADYWKDMYGFACMERDKNIKRVEELEKQVEELHKLIRYMNKFMPEGMEDTAKIWLEEKDED